MPIKDNYPKEKSRLVEIVNDNNKMLELNGSYVESYTSRTYVDELWDCLESFDRTSFSKSAIMVKYKG